MVNTRNKDKKLKVLERHKLLHTISKDTTNPKEGWGNVQSDLFMVEKIR